VAAAYVGSLPENMLQADRRRKLMKRQSLGIGLCLEYGQMCRISTGVKTLCQAKGKRRANTGQSVWI
jgi:hypothetical protein